MPQGNNIRENPYNPCSKNSVGKTNTFKANTDITDSTDFWYCLPDSLLLRIYNPETSSQVTLASLGTVFQTWLAYSVNSWSLSPLSIS